MTIVDEFRQQPQRVLDRLVDGELAPQQRRELLLALDDEPGAWRMCAVAFLESQAWRLEMARVASEPILASVHAGARSQPTRPAPRERSAWAWSLAAAAGLLVAFVLGTRHAPRPLAGDVPPADALVQNDPAQAQEPAAPSDEPAEPERHAADANPSNDPTASAKADDAPPWRTLTLKPVGDPDAADPLEVRVLETDGDAPSPLLAPQADLASHLTRQLQRDGWEVNRTERLLPIDLSDGRRVLVPIEQVDFHSPDVVSF